MRRLRAGFLLCSMFICLGADAVNVRVALIHTPSGVYSELYPTGDDGSQDIPLVWATIPRQTGIEGAPLTIDLRALYLTEAGSPNATLVTSCTPTLDGGWTTSADGLSFTFSSAYAGSCQTTATRDTVAVVSNPYIVESIADGTADNVAPTLPAGLTATLNSSNQPVIIFDAGQDPVVAGKDTSGLSTYTVLRDGTPLTPVAFPAGSIAPSLTSADIGTLSPVGTSTQSNADWLDTAEGDLGSTSDAFRFTYAPIQGDFVSTIQVESFADVVSNFAKASLHARNGTATNAAYAGCRASPNGSFALEYRAIAGGAKITVSGGGAGTLAYPAFTQFARTADVFSCRYSADGNNWVNSVSQAVALPTTLNVGRATTSTSDGNVVTVQYRKQAIQKLARVTYTDTGATPGSTYSYTIIETDAAGNASAASAAVSIAVPTPASDVTAPAVQVQPSCSSGGQTTINCSCGQWFDANGIATYTPSVSSTSGSGFSDQTPQASASYTIGGLSAGNTRYFKCKATDPSANVSAYSAETSATTDSEAPPSFTAPTISSVQALSTSVLRITHTAVAGAHHYVCRVATTATGGLTVNDALDHTSTTVDHTGLSASTSRWYECAAADASEVTIGPYSNKVSGTTQSSPPSFTAIKWHPGHYMFLDSGSSQATHFTHIDAIAGEGNLKGVAMQIYWAEIETSQGVYNWTKIDAYLARAQSVGKRFLVRVQDRCFGCSSPNGRIPTYVQNLGGASQGIAASKNGWIARIWRADVMDRLIALYQAFGARYNSNAYMEAIATEESTAGFGSVTPPSDYSSTALHTQLRRLFVAARPAMPNTQILFLANFLKPECGSTGMQGTLSAAAANDISFSGPDILPNEGIDGYDILEGISCGHDYRGEVSVAPHMEAAGLGGGQGDYLPQQIYDFAKNNLRANYLIWRRNTWYGDANQQWTGGILPVIQANPIIHNTNCPSSFPSCNPN